jgi:uncharacterized protein YaaN involved in tellurite resistance
MEKQVTSQQPQVVERQQLVTDLNLNENDLSYVDTGSKKALDIDPTIVSEVQPQVDKFLQVLLDKKTDASEKTDYVYSLGRKAEQRKNEFLDRQMKELMAGDGNDQIAQGLLDLRDQISELDPNLYFGDDSLKGSLNTLARKLAGDNKFFKKLIRKYMDKYLTSEMVIVQIVRGLNEGKGLMERNNVTLKQEKAQMRIDVEQLKKAIAFGQLLDEKIETAIAETQDAEWKQILSEEILFPLRQRINTLQKARVAKNQSILVYEMIIRTNRQLINGILNSDQAIEILKTAITTELALKDAEKVNKAIAAMDQLTGDMLVRNSEKLKTVVMEVFKTAAAAGIPIEKLVIAQRNALDAVADHSKFIQDQLPKMKEEALRAQELNKEVESANDKMERGSRIGDKIAESMKDLF